MCIHMHMYVYKGVQPPVEGMDTPIYRSMHTMCMAMISHQQQLQQMLQQYLLLLAIVALLASVVRVYAYVYMYVYKGVQPPVEGMDTPICSSIHCIAYTTACTAAAGASAYSSR